MNLERTRATYGEGYTEECDPSGGMRYGSDMPIMFTSQEGPSRNIPALPILCGLCSLVACFAFLCGCCLFICFLLLPVFVSIVLTPIAVYR